MGSHRFIQESGVSAEGNIVPGHVDKVILIAIGRYHPHCISLILITVGSREIYRQPVGEPDVIGYGTGRNQAASAGDPRLVGLSPGGVQQHVELLLFGDKSRFEAHRIIPDPERRIAVAPARTDQGDP